MLRGGVGRSKERGAASPTSKTLHFKNRRGNFVGDRGGDHRLREVPAPTKEFHIPISAYTAARRSSDVPKVPGVPKVTRRIRQRRAEEFKLESGAGARDFIRGQGYRNQRPPGLPHAP